MKKFINHIAIIFITFAFINSVAFAQYKDVNETAVYAEAVKHLSSLGIFSGNEDGQFKPDSTITREQIVKVLACTLNQNKSAETMRNHSKFSDVNFDRWSNPYINWAVNNSICTGFAGGTFLPDDDVNYGQACTMIIKSIKADMTGYNDEWPFNFIKKADEMGFTKELSFKSRESLPRWAVAMIINKLWIYEAKQKKLNSKDLFSLDAPNLYTETIYFANRTISNYLNNDEILTDKGILKLIDTTEQLEPGNKYKFVIEGDKVVFVYKKIRDRNFISIKNYVDNHLSYNTTSGTKTMLLQENLTYYFEGKKVDLAKLNDILESNSSIVFIYNQDKSGYEYAVVYNPIYSNPKMVSKTKIGSYSSFGIKPTDKIIKNGKMIEFSDCKEKDILYKITDISGANKYYLVIDKKVIGNISEILPTKTTPKSVKILDKTYELGKYFKINKINDSPDEFNPGNSVILLLGHDNKVVDIMPFDNKTGIKIESIILGNYKTMMELSQNEILTDTGKYTLNDDNFVYEVCSKYELEVYNNVVFGIGKKTTSTISYPVESVSSDNINYKTDTLLGKIKLPTEFPIFYQGKKATYETVIQSITYNSTVIFAKNIQNNTLEYTVVLEPIYGKAIRIENMAQLESKQLGDISLLGEYKILKSGRYVDITSLRKDDIVYEVTNLYSKNRYLRVIDNKVIGKITAILPDRLNPKFISIDNKDIEIDKKIDLPNFIEKIKFMNMNDEAVLLLGYEDKIVDIQKLDYTIGTEFECIVLGSSQINYKIPKQQIVTDKGLFYLLDVVSNLKIGSRYRLAVNGDKIVAVYDILNNTNGLCVESFSNNTAYFKKDGQLLDMYLPQGIIYYYNGTKYDSSKLSAIIEYKSTLIFGYNSNPNIIDYIIVIAPIFSIPELVKSSNIYKKLNSSSSSKSMTIIKNSEIVNVSDLKNEDVIYEVSNYYDDTKYYYVLENILEGLLTQIYPHRLSPKGIRIENTFYELSEFFNYQKLTSTQDYSLGKKVKIILDLDSKVLEILPI